MCESNDGERFPNATEAASDRSRSPLVTSLLVTYSVKGRDAFDVLYAEQTHSTHVHEWTPDAAARLIHRLEELPLAGRLTHFDG